MISLPKKSVIDANIFINYIRDDSIEKTNQFVHLIIKEIEDNNIDVFLPDIAFHEVMYNLKKNVSKDIILNNAVKIIKSV